MIGSRRGYPAFATVTLLPLLAVLSIFGPHSVAHADAVGLEDATRTPPTADPGPPVGQLARYVDEQPGRTSPRAGFDTTNTLLVAGLVAAAYTTHAAEVDGEFARGFDDSPADAPLDVANAYGDGITLGLAAVSMLGIGRALDSPALSTVGEDLTGSLARAWAATWVLKLSVDARRPNGGRYSFPSGHTATAFAAAPVFEHHFGPAIGGIAYGVAALTAIARIEERKHHAWDVLVGAAIGIVSGRHATKPGTLRIGPPHPRRPLGVTLRF